MFKNTFILAKPTFLKKQTNNDETCIYLTAKMYINNIQKHKNLGDLHQPKIFKIKTNIQPNRINTTYLLQLFVSMYVLTKLNHDNIAGLKLHS